MHIHIFTNIIYNQYNIYKTEFSLCHSVSKHHLQLVRVLILPFFIVCLYYSVKLVKATPLSRYAIFYTLSTNNATKKTNYRGFAWRKWSWSRFIRMYVCRYMWVAIKMKGKIARNGHLDIADNDYTFTQASFWNGDCFISTVIMYTRFKAVFIFSVLFLFLYNNIRRLNCIADKIRNFIRIFANNMLRMFRVLKTSTVPIQNGCSLSQQLLQSFVLK